MNLIAVVLILEISNKSLYEIFILLEKTVVDQWVASPKPLVRVTGR